MASRSSFRDLHLAQVDAGSCLADGLRGQLSARPDQLTPVRPSRRPQDVGNRVVAHGSDEEPDLYDMDPVAFEDLVADLFRAMGMQAVTTQRSNDGGVDVDALDPTPIRGGKIVVQVKRYRNTVPPTAVRDLYGTVQDAGANKGVLVTTSGFGPGSHTFANGKPLELISGSELVDLLHRHGLRGRLGEGGRPAAAQPDSVEVRTLGCPTTTTSWACHGPEASPWTCARSSAMATASSVTITSSSSTTRRHRTARYAPFPPTAPDKAAICVSFDGLPEEADRFVLVAAIDPEVNPDADLSGFTDACIRLLDPGMSELGRLEVSDGRPLETALVLGSFRRRSSGDWDFVLGGKGYAGGLEQLVQDYGIDVE